MKTLIFLLLIFCLLCSLVSSAQQKDTLKQGTLPKQAYTGIRNTSAALIFYDKGKEIGRLSASNDLTGKDSTGTVFIKNNRRGWYIVDSLRALPVLMRITELYLNLKRN
jgi:hypothetical protein